MILMYDVSVSDLRITYWITRIFQSALRSRGRGFVPAKFITCYMNGFFAFM